jgi:hypothetical protein
MQEEYIPETMATKLFDEYKMFRLMEQDDLDGPTFVIQLYTSSAERHRQYLDEFDPLLRQKAFEQWGGRFIAYRTLMSSETGLSEK